MELYLLIDSVDHYIFTAKLSQYGLWTHWKFLKTFQFLSRKQMTKVFTSQRPPFARMWSPTGVALFIGPVLFLIFINDL